jgi:hypothetical protein
MEQSLTELKNEVNRLRSIISSISCPNFSPQIRWGAQEQDPTPKPCGWCSVCRAHREIGVKEEVLTNLPLENPWIEK